MSARCFVTARGVEVAVEAHRNGDELSVRLGGDEPRRFVVRRVGVAEFVAHEPGRPAELHNLHAIREGDDYWIWLDGSTWHLRSVRRRAGTAPAAEGELVAPIPATVQEVLVRNGDTVEQGALLLVLTAMKMQLEVKAVHAGIVAALELAPGEQVDAGTRLLRVDPHSD